MSANPALAEMSRKPESLGMRHHSEWVAHRTDPRLSRENPLKVAQPRLKEHPAPQFSSLAGGVERVIPAILIHAQPSFVWADRWCEDRVILLRESRTDRSGHAGTAWASGTITVSAVPSISMHLQDGGLRGIESGPLKFSYTPAVWNFSFFPSGTSN